MVIIEQKKCNGCTACYSVCPKNAIQMLKNEEDFKYPVVDDSLCINCNLCQKVCPVLHPPVNHEKAQVYACVNKNNEIREKSSSGGLFFQLAKFVIDNDGVVVGAKFDDNFNVIHDLSNDINEIRKFMGSKYVQSNLNDIFKKIKNLLDRNILVLFTGTSCQIEGLKSFLQREYENLITQDFICHGVPSPKVWNIYKQSKFENFKVTSVDFRAKSQGWKNFSLKVESDNGVYDCSHKEDSFMQAFLNDLCLRSSCYDCSSKKMYRLSDITLADYWGVDKLSPKLDDDKGISLVIINTEKGKEVFNYIKKHLDFSHVNFKDAILYNSSYNKSVQMPGQRKWFISKLTLDNFDQLTLKAIKDKNSIINKLKNKLKNNLLK